MKYLLLVSIYILLWLFPKWQNQALSPSVCFFHHTSHFNDKSIPVLKDSLHCLKSLTYIPLYGCHTDRHVNHFPPFVFTKKMLPWYVHLWLIHVDVWKKTTKFCKAIILQLKINKFKKCCHEYPCDILLNSCTKHP